jgi:serine/threonine protein phosphatase 1
MRTLAIGDIHGCHAALAHLFKKVELSANDRVVFLGDYVDRGPASREVIESLLEVGKRSSAIFLRGNHELMMLQARQDFPKNSFWMGCGGLETLASYGVEPGTNQWADWPTRIPQSHWEFIERTAKFFETETHIFVHAGADPEVNMDAQTDTPLYWQSFERLRPHKSGKQIICGHSAQYSGVIKDVGFGICIDTGAAYGGWLTCLDVNNRKFWQTNEDGAALEGTL